MFEFCQVPSEPVLIGSEHVGLVCFSEKILSGTSPFRIKGAPMSHCCTRVSGAVPGLHPRNAYTANISFLVFLPQSQIHFDLCGSPVCWLSPSRPPHSISRPPVPRERSGRQCQGGCVRDGERRARGGECGAVGDMVVKTSRQGVAIDIHRRGS